MSSEDMMKLRAVRREFSETPDGLTVVVSPQQVIFTSGEGRVRKFSTDGKKQDIDLITAKVEVTARWDQDVLKQRWVAGRVKFAVAYQVTMQGKMLVMSIEPERDKNDPGTGGIASVMTAKYVYERVETGVGPIF